MKNALVFSVILLVFAAGVDGLSAADQTKKSTASVTQEKQNDSKGMLDEYSDADLQTIIGMVQAQDAYGPPGISGTMSAVVQRVNSLPATHQEIEPTSIPATHSLESLSAGLLRLRESITSLELAYIKKRTHANPNEKTVIHHNKYAFKGELQYVMYSDVLPDLTTRNHEISVFNGINSLRYVRTQSFGNISKGRGAATTQTPRGYLELIPVFAGPDATGHDPTDDFVEFLKHYKRVTEISPHLEIVDGYPCHVVSSPLGFRMWIHVMGDSCYLIRYVEFTIEGDPNALVLNRIIAHRDFRKINDHFQWPFQTMMSYFGTISTDSTLHSHWSLTKEYTVAKIEFNNVKDDIFQLNFPPGTRVIDSTRKIYYLVPERTEDLERAIANGSIVLPDGTMPDWYQVQFGDPIQSWEGTLRQNSITFLIIVSLLFLLIMTYYFIHKRRSIVK